MDRTEPIESDLLYNRPIPILLFEFIDSPIIFDMPILLPPTFLHLLLLLFF